MLNKKAAAGREEGGRSWGMLGLQQKRQTAEEQLVARNNNAYDDLIVETNRLLLASFSYYKQIWGETNFLSLFP